MVKVKVYTTSFCPYCIRAKMLLKSLKQDFEEVKVVGDEFAKLSEKTGSMTVPQIFIGDKFIGGCDELYALRDSGELSNLLK